ncbi:MAG: guanylate kinase [Bifidobacteriaceae bacterium]|jgi:guanylate kinase|nr:guanylate kinase [Bifidobacteriaceae bacterium]
MAKNNLVNPKKSNKIKQLDNLQKNNRITVLAGPTAVGKGSISSAIREKYKDVFVSISYTNRELRSGEIEGVHYKNVSKETFFDLIKNNEFLEWAKVHNQYYYGTALEPVLKAVKEGKKVLLEIDLQGARAIRRLLPNSRFIFLAPPDFDTLVQRQKIRATEDFDEQLRRLETAKVEMTANGEFDYIVVNDQLSVAVEKIVKLMDLK